MAFSLGLTRLEESGIHFDDLNRVRILDEDSRDQATELRGTCDDFLRAVHEFKTISDSFVNVFDTVSKEVEREKISAIGARNLLQTSSKNREMQLQQLTALIVEKQMQLDRLSTELAALMNVEANQNDFMEQFVLRK